MLLSTGISGLLKFGEDKAIRLVAEAGFDAIDYTLFTAFHNDAFFEGRDVERYAREIRGKIDAAGLVCNQSHAPFEYPGEGTPEGFYRVERTIRIAGILGAEHIVVHPVNFCTDRAEKKERNLAMYRHYGEVARACGTKIAIENIEGVDKRRGICVPCGYSLAEEICDYYDTLNDPSTFCVLLDVGHSAIVGQDPQEAIRILGHDRLRGLHIQDNDYISDQHMMPYGYGGKLDWDEITKALGEIDYQGYFTFECGGIQNRMDESNVHIGLKFKEQIGRYLMRKIDESRPK